MIIQGEPENREALDIHRAKATSHRRNSFTVKCPHCGKRHWLMDTGGKYQLYCKEGSMIWRIPYDWVSAY